MPAHSILSRGNKDAKRGVKRRQCPWLRAFWEEEAAKHCMEIQYFCLLSQSLQVLNRENL
jgi:hypothetical protein